MVRKLLFIDIETSPNVAYVWGLYKQNVGVRQLIESSYTICFSAVWEDSDEVSFYSIRTHGHRKMVKKAHSLLSEADAVVGWNVSKFDLPTLNKEFILLDLPPPAPYKTIDLLKVARQKFRFVSNKLDYVAQALGVGRKVEHNEGLDLWSRCLAKDAKAWELMEKYNKQDVALVKKIYHVMLPWIGHHGLNLSAHTGGLCCPSCGSQNYQARGYAITKVARYRRYQCKECGTWFRDNTRSLEKDPTVFVPVQ